MAGKVCIKCGLLSPRFKSDDEAEKAGWMWGDLRYTNGAILKFDVCRNCKKEKIPFLEPGWTHKV